MSWSEVRPWHAKYFWESRVGNPKIPKPLACPGLRSDRGMQNTFGEIGASNPKFQNPLHVLVWGQTVACNHVFRNPPPRFMDLGFFRNLGHADITGQLISACHGLTSDRDMQISFGPAQAECYKPRPFRYRIYFSFHFILISWVQVLNFKEPNHICMSRSEARPWHADISWPVISACPKFRKKSEIHKSWRWISEHMVACHGLTSDQDMQGVFGILGCLPQFPRSILHAMVWPQTRTCKGPWNFGWLAYPRFLRKYFACHGLTSEQDMQGVLEVWGCLFAPDSQKCFACHGLTSDQDMQRVLEILLGWLPLFWRICAIKTYHGGLILLIAN